MHIGLHKSCLWYEDSINDTWALAHADMHPGRWSYNCTESSFILQSIACTWRGEAHHACRVEMGSILFLYSQLLMCCKAGVVGQLTAMRLLHLYTDLG